MVFASHEWFNMDEAKSDGRREMYEDNLQRAVF